MSQKLPHIGLQAIVIAYTNMTKSLSINFVGIPPNVVENSAPEAYVNCIVSIWGPWGSCYSTCGPGIQTRQRSIE